MLIEGQKEEYKKFDKSRLNGAFVDACKNRDLEIVKYLLTSKDLKEHADIHAENDYGFIWACQRGHLEVVKYLLTSDELKEHANVHAYKDLGFEFACKKGYLDVVKCLIFDRNIEKTKEISSFLNKTKGDNFVDQAKEMFESRDLKESLSHSLNGGANKGKIKL